MKFWARLPFIVCVCGSSSVHCRVFNSTSYLCPLLDGSSTPSLVVTKISPDIAKYPPGGKIALAENRLSEAISSLTSVHDSCHFNGSKLCSLHATFQ